MLPATLPAELAQARLGGLYEQELAGLSPDARRLAEALSPERGAIALRRCLDLSGMGDREAFAALGELVVRGVLDSADDRYHFSHGALRDHLLRSLPAARAREAHLRSAALSLREEASDELVKIDAGWHLIRGGEELRGAELLEEASRKLVQSVEGLQHAAPALEAALEVYERHGKSPWVLLPMLDALTAAGWYVDHTYVQKYGERTLDLALELSGLALAEKLAPVMGERAALAAGLAAGMAKHALARKHIKLRRHQKFAGVFTPLVGSVGIMIGVAANKLDGPEARRVLTKARMMRAFAPGHTLSIMYDYARYFTLTAEGRFGEAEPIAEKVLAWFQSPQGKRALGEEGAAALCGGIMTGIAEFSTFRDDTKPGVWADRLDGLGLSFYRAMATQARFTHHVVRGESERARAHREQLELHAIQLGTLWQSSIIVPVITAGVCARCGDAVGLRQAIDALAARAAEIPVLEAYAGSHRATLDLLHGRPAEALRRIEALLPRVGTHKWGEWTHSMVTYARALLGVGQTQRAREVLGEIRAARTPADQPYVLMTLDVDLLAAEVEEADGRLGAAARMYDELIERHRPNRNPLTLFRLYEARAQLSLQQQEEAMVDVSLEALGYWARLSGNPVLIARERRLRREARRGLGRASMNTEDLAELADSDVASILSTLESTSEDERPRVALRLAVERSGARGGYLYLGNRLSLRLACAVPEDDLPPSELTEDLLALAARTDGVATAHAGEDLSSATEHLGELQYELLFARTGAARAVVGALVMKRPNGSPLAAMQETVLTAIAGALAPVREDAKA